MSKTIFRIILRDTKRRLPSWYEWRQRRAHPRSIYVPHPTHRWTITSRGHAHIDATALVWERSTLKPNYAWQEDFNQVLIRLPDRNLAAIIKQLEGDPKPTYSLPLLKHIANKWAPRALWLHLHYRPGFLPELSQQDAQTALQLCEAGVSLSGQSKWIKHLGKAIYE